MIMDAIANFPKRVLAPLARRRSPQKFQDDHSPQRETSIGFRRAYPLFGSGQKTRDTAFNHFDV